MTLQQLEYILAVDRHRHFATAAQSCFITQPTLSMMIHKLEDELGLKIFDRSRQPVEPTREGVEIIRRAKAVLAQAQHLKEYVGELKGEMSGTIHIGIIPTLAPYLLPLFLKSFHEKYPLLRIFVREMVTDEILLHLRSGELDMGLCATPVHDKNLWEQPLFYEEFFAYASREEHLPRKKYLLPKQINVNHLWLLEEGHCLRNQVFNLCELKKRGHGTLNYEAGSIETLINLVDRNQGITIIPELAALNLKSGQKKNIREFANPKPVREISLLTNRNFPRKKIIVQLKEEILRAVPSQLLTRKQKKITSLEM
jgi:LysR family transcriptional regulator, hydrogen peroxide-inducible genes activator